jgi:hypothetical protein
LPVVSSPYWQAALGTELLGAYLIGSLAHAGFSRRYSDVDTAVVMEAGLSRPALALVRSEASHLVERRWPEQQRLTGGVWVVEMNRDRFPPTIFAGTSSLRL